MSERNPGDPAAATTKASVVRLERQWFVGCTSRDLRGRGPIARTLQGTPLVLFREDDGRAAALLDRCPHRNVPLSLGRPVDDGLECAYHGWRFDSRGGCRAIPGLVGPPDSEARRVPSFATREVDGLVWVFSTPDVEPEGEPFRMPLLGDRRYTVVRRRIPVRATMHAAIENTLDVPHTAFLHRGLFRTGQVQNEIEVVIRRGEDRVEAEYLGEPRPPGLAGRLLAPGGGTVVHVDRFFLPCVTQVEYRLGESSRFVATVAFTPVTDFETEMYASVAFRLPAAAALLRPLIAPIVTRIVRQDARILAEQTDAILRFGGERFSHTEIDVLGPYVWHLFRQAGRGKRGAPDKEVIRRRMRT